MNMVLKWGVILAALVSAISLVITLTGLHTNPLASLGFIVIAILINLVIVFLGLRASSKDSRYLQQLLSALMIGVFGGVLILAVSYSMTSLIFPSYVEDLKTGYEEFIRASAPQTGLTDEQVTQQVEVLKGTTAMGLALQGLYGTIGTSLLAGAIIGIFLRKK